LGWCFSAIGRKGSLLACGACGGLLAYTSGGWGGKGKRGIALKCFSAGVINLVSKIWGNGKNLSS
jgi:hypothetical protein